MRDCTACRYTCQFEIPSDRSTSLRRLCLSLHTPRRHLPAIYRACGREHQHLLEQGATHVADDDVELAHKVPGAENLNIVVQALGGWGTMLSRQWTPVHFGDGCHDFTILLDGDGAYDYTRPGPVTRSNARRFLARLRRDRIEVKVLDRYGLDNYFPRHAFEAVMGRDLTAHFPLDPRRPVTDQIRGYNKNMNVCLAKRTTLDDLAGTDLEDFLKRVGQLASNSACLECRTGFRLPWRCFRSWG